MNFKDNPEFVECFNDGNVILYMPAEISAYHKSRELAMQVQDSYSRCGVSRDVLASLTDKLLELANKQNNTDTLKTDIGVIANNLRYRMSNIVDEQCIIRMAAIACFIEGEDPNSVSEAWTNRKVKLSEGNPGLYSFFLDTGVAFTPEYNALLRGLQAGEYLANRKLVIDGLTLQSTLPT